MTNGGSLCDLPDPQCGSSTAASPEAACGSQDKYCLSSAGQLAFWDGWQQPWHGDRQCWDPWDADAGLSFWKGLNDSLPFMFLLFGLEPILKQKNCFKMNMK